MKFTVTGHASQLDADYTVTWADGTLTGTNNIDNLIRLYLGEPAYLPPHGPTRTLSLSDPLSIVYWLQSHTRVESGSATSTAEHLSNFVAKSAVRSAVTNHLVQKDKVRTAAGAKKYGQPIGSVIVRDIYQHRPRKRHGAQYRIAHTAPSESYGAPMHDLTHQNNAMFPNDVYDRRTQLQYYGTGERKSDRESFAAINGARGTPGAQVTIYRAAPEDVATINPGDWVTPSRSYAQMHLDGPMDGQGHVISAQVPARELWTNGDSINEWGWHPPPSDKFATEAASRITPVAPLTPLQVKNRDAWLALHQIDAETLQANIKQLLDAAGHDAVSYGEPWYFNAHLYAREYAEKYAIPVDTAAAVIARLSPRNKWHVPGALNKDGRDLDAEGRGNLANARIVFEAVQALDDPAERDRRLVITGALFDKNRRKLGSSANLVPASRRAEIADVPGGTRLGDLTPAELALFHPDVVKGDALPSNSAPALRIAFGEITIDKGLGNEAKVRSFYNNIVAPGADDSVTIDTHQSRAMMLKIDYPEAAYGAIAKVGPRYQFFADQVRTVAAERHMHPHQVQAIMWEQWRVDNPPAKRRDATRALLALPQHDALDKDGAPKRDDKGNIIRVVDYKVGDAIYEVPVKKLESEQRTLDREIAAEQKKAQRQERARAKEAKASQTRRNRASDVTLTGGGSGAS